MKLLLASLLFFNLLNAFDLSENERHLLSKTKLLKTFNQMVEGFGNAQGKDELRKWKIEQKIEFQKDVLFSSLSEHNKKILYKLSENVEKGITSSPSHEAISEPVKQDEIAPAPMPEETTETVSAPPPEEVASAPAPETKPEQKPEETLNQTETPNPDTVANTPVESPASDELGIPDTPPVEEEVAAAPIEEPAPEIAKPIEVNHIEKNENAAQNTFGNIFKSKENFMQFLSTPIAIAILGFLAVFLLLMLLFLRGKRKRQDTIQEYEEEIDLEIPDEIKEENKF